LAAGFAAGLLVVAGFLLAAGFVVDFGFCVAPLLVVVLLGVLAVDFPVVLVVLFWADKVADGSIQGAARSKANKRNRSSLITYSCF
jgi:hypothetical protein